MFGTVLVANRGEIAIRVMRTCERLGIRTVAVYSDADANAPHVGAADRAVRIGPPPATESYLDIDSILAAAETTGADAIHPGYGFLSENATFAERCAKAGVVFIGPSPESIRVMGDKAAAKRLLEPAGVPLVPGVHGEDLDDDTLVDAANDIGFPVLVKAAAGGGGKGMRAVHEAGALRDGLEAARREAQAAFGDGTLILEKLIERPRHVEIQVFGDHAGKVLHLRERECSVQRRHQKVVEETPSPAVDEELREEMGAAAVRAAEAVDYVGAGTVEFLLGPDRSFYFLEMNTRLQVEHPVTELVTGLDLVEWQLRVAAGEPLDFAQEDVTGNGHAIEVRLYAEDPANEYLPQTGQVLRFSTPEVPGARIDAGITDGTTVSRFYDPMLAKLIVHGRDRDDALARMRALLAGTAALGLTTNLSLLQAVVGHDAFRDGDISTAFLDEHLPGWSPPGPPDELIPLVATALAEATSATPAPGDPTSPWARLGPWRSGALGGWRQRMTIDDAEVVVDVGLHVDGLHVSHDQREHVVSRIQHGDRGRLGATIDGTPVNATTAVVNRPDGGWEVWVHTNATTHRVPVAPPTRHADPGRTAAGAAFVSPMPGAVIAVNVEEGQTVSAGTTMVVVEAMKMEHPVTAPVDGTVTALFVSPGDAVDGGQELLAFEPSEES